MGDRLIGDLGHRVRKKNLSQGRKSINKCMKHLCEYGCNQEATYFKLPTPKVPNGRYSCLPSPNSCSAKRNKTKGDLNPSKRKDVRKILSDTNSKLFAKGSPLRKKCEETLLDRYGVKNPMSIPGVSKQFVANRRAKNNYQSFSPQAKNQEAKDKAFAKKLSKGLVVDPALKTPFARYEREVDMLTEQAYNNYKHIINPQDLTRGRTIGTHQLDHILSKLDGFKLNLPPKLIAHPANLRMLTSTENKSKSSKSHYTKEELMHAIEDFFGK
jgi:hypothetical protein